MPDSNQYFKGYLKAVNMPLLDLKQTFEKETIFLDEMMDRYDCRSAFLDVGTGIGRTIFDLDRKNSGRLFVGMDNNSRMICLAKKNLRNASGNNAIFFLDKDIMNSAFDGLLSVEYAVVYSGFNLIGSIDLKETDDFNSRSFLIERKKELTKKDGLVITTSWKQYEKKKRWGDHERTVSEFLNAYYKYIGYKSIDVQKDGSVVNDMTFYRLSIDEMIEHYRANNLKNIEVHDLGLWNAVVGRK